MRLTQRKLASISPERAAADPRPRLPSSPAAHAPLAMIGIGATAVAASAAAAVVVVSAGPASAFAGWTATPASVSGTALAQARKVCGDVPATDVLTSESRGPFVAIVFEQKDAPWQCITRGIQRTDA